MSPLAETLKALASVFDKLEMRWYLFGAQAAILHGVARATADIDVTIDPGTHTTLAIAAALTAGGFTLRFPSEDFVTLTRVLPITHERGVPVDVVLAGPGLEELFFERVVERVIGGVTIPVASAEDLIVMKILAGRPKDVEDVRGIISAKQATLDVELVRATLRLLEQALDQGDLLPAFEQILSAK